MFSYISCLHSSRAVTRTGTCTMLLRERRVSSKRTLSFSREENLKTDIRCWTLHVCAEVRSHRISGVLLNPYPPYSLKRAAHCTWSSLTAEPAGHLGHKCTLPCLDIYMSAGDPNLGPHTCTANALPTKPSSSPLVFFYILTYFIHSMLTTSIICLKTSNTFQI